MKLRYKIFLIFLLGSLVLMVLSIGLFYYTSSENLRESISKQLQTAAEFKTSQVGQYLDTLVVRTVDFSSDGAIRQALVEVQTTTSSVRATQDRLREHLIVNKLPVDASLLTVFVVDATGEIVASSHQGDRATRYFPEAELRGIEQAHVYTLEYSDILLQPVLAAYAPIYVEGVYYGGIINVFTVDTLYGFLTDRTLFHQTWESYLVNSDFYMVSPSRFVENAEFSQVAETENTIDCFEKKTSLDFKERNLLNPHLRVDTQYHYRDDNIFESVFARYSSWQ
jgi:hypothetical protein